MTTNTMTTTTMTTTTDEIASRALPQVVLVTGVMGGPARHEHAAELVAALTARGTATLLMDLAVDAPAETLPARLGAVLAANASTDALVVDGGGLLVPVGPRGQTLADLARALLYKGISVGVVVVPTPGEGAANDAALHAAALDALAIPLLAVTGAG